MSGVILPLLAYASMPWAGANFALLYLNLTSYDVVPQSVVSVNLISLLNRHEVLRFFIPVVFYAIEGGWFRQNTTVVGSYLLV
jgi:hypothetical protein